MMHEVTEHPPKVEIPSPFFEFRGKLSALY